MGETWTGVRERVLALRYAPNRRAVFGAYFKESGHEFELRPVLTEEQVDAVERQRGVRFPAEYRSFLLEVGAGGAGPDYGLFPIEPPEPGEAATAPSSAPSSAPPFRPEATAEWEEHQAAEPYRSAYGDSAEDDERFRAAHAAWDERDDELLESLADGALYVTHQGCAYYTLLVLTGPERGTMWQDVRAAAEGMIPFRFLDSTNRVTFAQWYLHWLTRAERLAWQAPESAGETGA
ncbi:SMI1/KNR4 family protein [Streptomyces sp. NPDC005562]|uniref:SMI1/KNR4 family protein n=1 Tax=Streptomyces sp. NPDC005562 TaxID=3154890 RepID=UPI0033BC6936